MTKTNQSLLSTDLTACSAANAEKEISPPSTWFPQCVTHMVPTLCHLHVSHIVRHPHGSHTASPTRSSMRHPHGSQTASPTRSSHCASPAWFPHCITHMVPTLRHPHFPQIERHQHVPRHVRHPHVPHIERHQHVPRHVRHQHVPRHVRHPHVPQHERKV